MQGESMVRFFNGVLLSLVLSISSVIFTHDAAQFCCQPKKVIYQEDVPFVINKPGKYKLGQDITYTGSGSAITIASDAVTLRLGAFSIVLTDNNGTGISVIDSSEFAIERYGIKNTSLANSLGTGIYIVNCSKGYIENIFTVNHFDGLLINNSTDITIKYSQFLHAFNVGALVVTSTNIVFDSCVFADSYLGLAFSEANQDCTIINCEFPSATMSNLVVQQINGMIIENCSFTNTSGDPAKANLIQFGGGGSEQVCNDVIIKNCTLINRPAHTPTLGNTAPEGLGIYQGSGFLVESCVIDIDNTDQDPTLDLSGIHISNPGLGLNGTVACNVVIRNCVVQGPATNGFYPDVGSSGVVIEYCVAANAQKNGIFLAGTTASSVHHNTVVGNGTNGIFLGETSVSNSITNNVVVSNGSNPIVTSLPPVGNGISIASDSSKNAIAYNEVFNNSVNGIDDEGTGNRIYGNTAYANANKNYNAATDVIVVSNPGDPAKSAENISA